MTVAGVYGMPESFMKAVLSRALILLALSVVSTPARDDWPELRGP
jgi:hypothetical protein